MMGRHKYINNSWNGTESLIKYQFKDEDFNEIVLFLKSTIDKIHFNIK